MSADSPVILLVEDVLEWLRQQPQFANLPVFVLTSSAEDRDRERAAQLGANGYLVKPPTREMIETTRKTWMFQ